MNAIVTKIGFSGEVQVAVWCKNIDLIRFKKHWFSTHIVSVANFPFLFYFCQHKQKLIFSIFPSAPAYVSTFWVAATEISTRFIDYQVERIYQFAVLRANEKNCFHIECKLSHARTRPEIEFPDRTQLIHSVLGKLISHPKINKTLSFIYTRARKYPRWGRAGGWDCLCRYLTTKSQFSPKTAHKFCRTRKNSQNANEFPINSSTLSFQFPVRKQKCYTKHKFSFL